MARADESLVGKITTAEVFGGPVPSKITSANDLGAGSEWSLEKVKDEMYSKGHAIASEKNNFDPYTNNPGSVNNPDAEWVTWNNARISYNKRQTVKHIGKYLSDRMFKSFSNRKGNIETSTGNAPMVGYPGTTKINGDTGNDYYTRVGSTTEAEANALYDVLRDPNYYSMFGNPDSLSVAPSLTGSSGRGLAMGESLILNPDFQFNELDDIRSDFRRPAIGRLYSERIYDYNLPKVLFQVGTVKVNLKMITGLSALFFNNIGGKSLGDYLRDPEANFIKRAGMKLAGAIGSLASSVSSIIMMNKRMYKFISDNKTYIKYVNEVLAEISAWMGLGRFDFGKQEIDGIQSLAIQDNGVDDEGKITYSENEKITWGLDKDGNLTEYNDNTGAGIGKDGYAGKDKYLSVRNILPTMNKGDFKKADSWFSPYPLDIYVPFALSKGVSVNETFSNSTQENPIISTLNSTGMTNQEQIMVGQVPSNALQTVDSIAEGGMSGALDDIRKQGMTRLASITKNFLGGNMSGEVGMVQNGTSRMILPELWTDSSFDRSYSLNFKLFSPYGNRLSIFENTMVPLIFLIAMTAPRQVGESSYTTPFCVKAFSKGLFSTNLGMVSSLSINRGEGKNERTTEGFARVVNVSMSIKDLMPRMTMSLDAGMWGILGSKNEGFRDYISFIAGVDLIDREYTWKKFEIYANVLRNNYNLDALKDNIRYMWSQSLPAKLITSPRSIFFKPSSLESLNSSIGSPSNVTSY